MGKLDGKVAIITGGSRGQGQATAELFVREGAKVSIVDVRDEEGSALAQKLGESVMYHHLDISDEKGWEELVKSVIERYGHIDVLVNNAALNYYALTEDCTSETFHRLLDVNLVGPFLGMKAVMPHMKEQMSGSIINICSTEGFRGCCGTGAYNATKWGLRGLTKCIAMELGPFGVRVNSLHPGAINTPMLNPDGGPVEQFSELWTGIALSRVGEPEEIAKINLFLASEDASYVTGAEIAADGGWTCGVYIMEKPSPVKKGRSATPWDSLER